MSRATVASSVLVAAVKMSRGNYSVVARRYGVSPQYVRKVVLREAATGGGLTSLGIIARRTDALAALARGESVADVVERTGSSEDYVRVLRRVLRGERYGSRR